jgi:hypothetical protein
MPLTFLLPSSLISTSIPSSVVITVKAAAGNTSVKRLQHQDCGLSDGLHEPASDLARWTLNPGIIPTVCYSFIGSGN